MEGLVLKLGGELSQLKVRGQSLTCGGGTMLPRVANRAAALGLSGIEFGVNIPGTIGGAVRMNANCHDGEFGPMLDWVEVWSPRGHERRQPHQLGLGYRTSNLLSDEIVTAVQLTLRRGAVDAAQRLIADLRARRERAQPPQETRTFGSAFKNPATGHSAWSLLADAGAQALRFGGARFSEKHVNFVDNSAGATTADIVALMNEAHRLVVEHAGIDLEPEVHTLGPVPPLCGVRIGQTGVG